ncbi:hypothetical protein ACFL4D_02265 [Candidatus Margulisiibacteriota bacterium]
MIKNLIKLLWTVLFISLVFAYLLLFIGLLTNSFLFIVCLLLFALSIFSWFFVTARLAFFKNKLTNILRFILAGDYERGIKLSGTYEDEVTSLAKLVNQVAERLGAYDKLRAERVAFSYKAIDIIYRTVEEGLIIANIDKKTFQFNPVIRKIFDVEQENISFEALQKQTENQNFMAIFDQIVNVEKVPQTATVQIQLPVRESKQRLQLNLVPVKDNKEKVKLVLIFAKQALH